MNKKFYKVTAAILYNDKNEILITKRPAQFHLGGLWEFPGGRIEDHELPEQALIRELKEEVDLDIKVEKLFWRETFEYDIKIIDIFFYICKLIPARQKITPKEVDDYRWVLTDELHQFEFPEADRHLVERLKQQSDVDFQL